MKPFVITAGFIDGMEVWMVIRADGQSFENGVTSYNFAKEDLKLAHDCCNRLNMFVA
jgi:tRNA(His) 5'-end guanylyltransferase